MPKVYLVLRKDLNMSAGKLAVQVGHGVDYVHLKKTGSYREWLENSNRKKIVTQINDAIELAELKVLLIQRSVPYCEIWDAGLTEFKTPTQTGIVILPWPPELVPGRVKALPLWK